MSAYVDLSEELPHDETSVKIAQGMTTRRASLHRVRSRDLLEEVLPEMAFMPGPAQIFICGAQGQWAGGLNPLTW
jgi:hypothetical protein